MLFTREPIIETVITARSGFRLVVRNSKYPQEELLVDALEIVSFGSALFYRCTERPKAFLVPVSDYDVSEVRETRLVLKHLAQTETKHEPRERESRRGSKEPREPKESHAKEHAAREHPSKEKAHALRGETEAHVDIDAESSSEGAKDSEATGRNDRRRDRRRSRRRRGESRSEEDSQAPEAGAPSEQPVADLEPSFEAESEPSASPVPMKGRRTPAASKGPMQLVSALIPPPPTLVSDIFRYERLDNEGVRQAVKLADQVSQETDLQAPTFADQTPQVVTEARSHLMEALDFYAGDEETQSGDEDES